MKQNITIGTEIWLSKFYNASLEVVKRYSGSIGDIELAIEKIWTTCKHKIKTPVYSPYTRMEEFTKSGYLADTSGDNFTVRDGSNAVVTEDSVYENDWTEKRIHPRYKVGMTLDEASAKILIGNKPINKETYQLVVHAMNLHTENIDMRLILNPIIGATSAQTFVVPPHDGNPWTRPYIIELESTNKNNQVLTQVINQTGNDLIIFSIELYKKISDYEKQLLKLHNECHNIVDFYWEDNTSYQYDLYSTENNKRYKGSKITGPGFNIPSDETYDRGPVVSFTEVNPNSLINSGQDSSSNLRVE